MLELQLYNLFKMASIGRCNANFKRQFCLFEVVVVADSNIEVAKREGVAIIVYHARYTTTDCFQNFQNKPKALIEYRGIYDRLD